MTPLWAPSARDVLAVRGPDAITFLQGQLSQDVAALGVGASAWSLLLQPTGKVDALVRVLRLGGDEVVVDVDGGFGEAVVLRLNRFKLRTKAEIEVLPWRCLAVRGEGAAEVAQRAVAAAPHDAYAVVGWWADEHSVDLLGPAPHAPEEAVAASAEALHRLRVEAGWPAMGAELTADTIPAESGVVPLAASFTKGCYTGQELVARIDSRGGHVPRYLRRLVLGGPVAPGTALQAGGKVVGTVTSVANDLALGYVARTVEVPAVVVADETEVRVQSVPDAKFQA